MPSQADMGRERSRERLRREGRDIQKSEKEQERRKPELTPSESTEPQPLRREIGPSDWQFRGPLIEPEDGSQQ